MGMNYSFELFESQKRSQYQELSTNVSIVSDSLVPNSPQLGQGVSNDFLNSSSDM